MKSFFRKASLQKCTFGLLLLVLVFVLTSCSSSTNSGTLNYRTGSGALEMNLINPGVEDFFEGDELVVLVEYFNKGTADITDGEFYVSGYDLNYLQLSLDPKYLVIEGKDEYDPTGSRSQILTIKSNSLRLPTNADEFSQSIKLTACYSYETLSTAEICVDPDPNNRRVQDKICSMSAVSPGAQGAPIVVTRVEPIVSKNDLRLNIEFQNNGDGIAFDRTISNDVCFADLDKYSDVNKIDITRVEYSGYRLSCQPTNPVRMVNGIGRATCICEGCVQDYMDAFETLVTIELAYGYRNELLKTVRILSDY